MTENLKNRIMTNLWRVATLGFLALIWEFLAHYKIIDIFYFSKPSLILLDFYKLFSTGLKTGIGVALLGAIVGEYIGSAAGLGYLVQYAGNMFDTTRVLSTILVMTMIMVVLNEMVGYAEKFVLRWRPAHQHV